MIGIVQIDQRVYSDHDIKRDIVTLNPYISYGALSRSKPRPISISKQKLNNKKSFTRKEDRVIINETESEYRRRGKFRRIFPNTNYSYYKTFFEIKRPLNSLLSDHLLRKILRNDTDGNTLVQKRIGNKSRKTFY